MYWEKRLKKDGTYYYSFIQWDSENGRNIRLKKSEIPLDIKSDAQANDFCKLRESEHEACRIRIQRKLSWQKKYYDFEDLLTIFETEMKTQAPNSWETSLYYLRQYVFDFFLTQKQSNNLNNWPLHFENFRDWLLIAKPSKKTISTGLSYNTRNNIITALNTFLCIMNRKGKCDHFPKCIKFPSHLTNKRTADDVISYQEGEIIEDTLRLETYSQISADFFNVLMSTGMRLSEGLGLSITDFFPHQPNHTLIRRALERHKIPCYGYLSLESQVSNATHIRRSDKSVPRKPLKGRRRIDANSGRIIPITDKKTFNILARLYNQQLDLFDQRDFGANKADYLLFNGLNKNTFSRHLRFAYQNTTYKPKSPHCTRHTFATNFAGLTNADTALCRLVLGHRDEDTTLGYVHLFEQINRIARTNELVRNKIEFLE